MPIFVAYSTDFMHFNQWTGRQAQLELPFCSSWCGRMADVQLLTSWMTATHSEVWGSAYEVAGLVVVGRLTSGVSNSYLTLQLPSTQSLLSKVKPRVMVHLQGASSLKKIRTRPRATLDCLPDSVEQSMIILTCSQTFDLI